MRKELIKHCMLRFSLGFVLFWFASSRDTLVQVLQAEVRDDANLEMQVTMSGGVVTVQQTMVYGDADDNGQLSPADINYVINWLVGREAMPVVSAPGFMAADVNGDQVINLADINLIMALLLGRSVNLPG